MKVHNLPRCPVCDHPLVDGTCQWHGAPAGPVRVENQRVSDMNDEEREFATTAKKLPGPAGSGSGLFHPDMKAVKARKRHDRIMQNTPVIVNQPNQADLVDSIRELMQEAVGSRALPNLHQTKQLGVGNTNSRFCTQCGEASSSSDRFCAGCGSPLQNEIIIEPNQDSEDKEDEDSDSGRTSTPMF